ncbi:hypothetical protein RB25_14130 [Herbaspirillum rubrisubalbicans]|nr:hypothetical protein RB25_14130 [Herbaspirillum rubrisubalbicans]
MQQTHHLNDPLTWPVTINGNKGRATDDQLTRAVDPSRSPQQGMSNQMQELILNFVTLINRSAQAMLRDVIDQCIAIM